VLRLTAGELAEIMGGTLIKGEADTKIKGIMAKCARVQPGFLYFDVVGGKGGNENILTALENGAASFVISKHKKQLPFEDPNIPVISAPRVWDAFWAVVKYYRDQYDIPVVGVTGTSGKTTTKEMITAVFRQRWKVLKTVGNMNLPDFVPSHLLRLHYGYQAAVFEMGMNRPGHIAKQARIIRPQVGVITHIGAGHVEHLGSLEKVIEEKAGIIEGIPENGYLVLNADDINTGKVDISGFKGRVIYYGLDNKADYMARDIIHRGRWTTFNVLIDGQNYRFSIPALGRHNVYNALAAIAVARIYDFEPEMIKKGLTRYLKPKMRLQFVKGRNNCVLINDSYNANPDSMMAGLEVLSGCKEGRTKVAVLGNMLEQGRETVINHRRVGQKAAQLKIDWLVTVGALAREIASGAAMTSKDMKIWSFRLKQQAIKFLKNNLPPESVVFVKGSRGAYMERVVRELRDREGEITR